MRLPALLLGPALLLTACTATDAGTAGAPGSTAGQSSEQAAEQAAEQPDDDAVAAVLRQPSGPAGVVAGTTAAQLAAGTSAALFEQAPVVVVVGEQDTAAHEQAAGTAASTGAPLLLAPAPRAGAGSSASTATGPAAAELERLDPQAVLAFGEAAAAWTEDLELDLDVVLAEQDGSPSDELPEVVPPRPADGTVVLTLPGAASVGAAATARAAGAEVLEVPAPDPRGSAAVVEQLSALAPEHVLGVGSAFADEQTFGYQVAAAATGVQLPGGGQLVLPGKRYIALYGHPGSKALGVLGEQGPEASVARAVQVATPYAQVRDDAAVVPTFEIITTVADAYPGPDGDYSSESTIEHLRGHVDAAARAGVYVVLDLQPGYTDFLTQAQRYEELLALPHVGLALDPEWRLAPGQRHMRQIGRVSAAEVNAVGDWMAELVRSRALPQKMLLLHQFKTFMLEDRDQIVADRPELAVITQMDGHGPPSVKMDTWRVLLQDPPEGMRFGWKNFYDEDSPTMSPAATMAVEPTPVFVSYQ